MYRHALRRNAALVVALGAISIASPALAAPYVPGMTCGQVGDFAESVADQMRSDPKTGFVGLTLKEQIAGLRQSIRGYPATWTALEKIIRAIYSTPALRSAAPDSVGKAYERACSAFGG